MKKKNDTDDTKHTIMICQAIKDSDGKQCTRKSTEEIAKVRYCKQHAQVYKRKLGKAHNTTQREPWAMIGLPEPLPSNGSKVIQKLRRKLLHGPSHGDPAGSIYIYHFEDERKLNYWKIGQTEGSVTERMKKWTAEHGKLATLYGSFNVIRNVRYIERIIQLYLMYCNMHRYPYLEPGYVGQQFHSVWALDPDEVIIDGQENQTQRLIALNKYVEWYKETIEYILSIVEPIVDTLQWQKQGEKKKKELDAKKSETKNDFTSVFPTRVPIV